MNKALLLIDYINDICNPQVNPHGCAVMIAENNIIARVNKLLAHARTENWLIIWVVVAFDPEYKEALDSPIFTPAKINQKLQRNTWGSAILSELNYQAGELIITKNVVNPFHGTNLEHVLRKYHIDDVYIAGVATEIAIQSCTRDAHDRGYKPHVIGDCCAGRSKTFHDISLEMLRNFASIETSDEIVN